MADEKTAKPDAEATTTEPEKPEAGVTIRSTDAADNAPAIELTETDEERTTREAAEAGAAGDEDDDAAEEDDATGADAGASEETGETEEERAAAAAEGGDTPTPKRHRPRAQDRINDALRERYRSDARAAALEKENEELKAAAEKPPPAAPTGEKDDTPDESPPEPKQDDFDTYEEFLNARTDWRVEEGLKAARADIRKEVLDEVKADRDRQAADAQLQADQDAVAAYSQRIDETRAAHPDFDEVIEKSGDVPISPPMREALIATPLAGTILYHFAQNPAVCAEIAEMPASQALVAMGRLEAQLEAEETPKGATGAQVAPTAAARTKPRLPKPVTPVGTSPATTAVSPDKMPYRQYKEYREKQERAAAGR